jgi:hypothetical protein
LSFLAASTASTQRHRKSQTSHHGRFERNHRRKPISPGSVEIKLRLSIKFSFKQQLHAQNFPHAAAAAAHGLLPGHLGAAAGLQLPPPPGGIGSGLLALGSVAGALVGHNFPYPTKDKGTAFASNFFNPVPKA